MIDYVATIYIRNHLLVGNTVVYKEKYLEEDTYYYSMLIGLFALYPLSYEIV